MSRSACRAVLSKAVVTRDTVPGLGSWGELSERQYLAIYLVWYEVLPYRQPHHHLYPRATPPVKTASLSTALQAGRCTHRPVLTVVPVLPVVPVVFLTTRRQPPPPRMRLLNSIHDTSLSIQFSSDSVGMAFRFFRMMLQSYLADATKMLQRHEDIVTPPPAETFLSHPLRDCRVPQSGFPRWRCRQTVRTADALKIVEKIVVGYQTGDKMNDEDNKLKYENMRKRETRNEKTRNPSRVSRQSREDIQR